MRVESYGKSVTVQQRVLVVAVLASFVSFLDGSVVNVALPAISDELTTGAVTGLALQQWVVDAYMITLGALAITGVFDFPKATGASTALGAGVKLYFDEAEQVATATVGRGSKLTS